jgi:hypothetical protein
VSLLDDDNAKNVGLPDVDAPKMSAYRMLITPKMSAYRMLIRQKYQLTGC